MSERKLVAAAVAAFIIGLALMIPFDYAATIAAGVVCLLAFIVLGVFALLTPDRLANEAEVVRDR